MTEQMVSLANMGILGNFIGMLTDSRSLLSYARHEYFRRILCSLLVAGWSTANIPQILRWSADWFRISATTTRNGISPVIGKGVYYEAFISLVRRF